uniref:Gag-Pol polyprotein n=1 Tax=Tanacetum cinerariifolium TaxID=118510 RepID=A0A6L2JEJ3_TANCI|nr:Gag-Pol polyprotein [Tanacetum cinerariifolium]
MTESPLVDSGFSVPVFSLGHDLIVYINKAMAFLIAVASSRFPSTNNQLRTSSNTRNQATIQDGRVTVQQVQGRQGQSYFGTGYKSNATSSRGNNASGQERVFKCYNSQGEGYMDRQCTQPKRPRNVAWYNDKEMLAEAQEPGQILDKEKLAFLTDAGVPYGQVVQKISPNNAAFQTKDLNTYDSTNAPEKVCTSMSLVEVEYVSLSACCAQVLWLRTQLTDYGFHFDKIPMYCDSKAAVAISCNPVQHYYTKHIDVRYHFIKEQVEKGIVEYCLSELNTS